jgi:APA family basic amino acid/polyamine antiporter
MIPVAGSAYTYSFATMGKYVAWIIGWDLVLEYAVGAATVGISWSRYLVKFLGYYHIQLPTVLTMSPFDSQTLADGSVVQGIINLPAVFIIMLMSAILMRGTKESAFVNALIVMLKVSVVIIFIALGWQFIRPENYSNYVPDNTGQFGEFGISGIVRAAAIVFFAYIGFDAVSTAAQEAKNPRKDMPIGILVSLAICTALYILFAHVMTGVANYEIFRGQDGIAPVAVAIDQMGTPDASGTIVPAYPWLNKAIIIAILAGYASVILVMLMGQSRVFFSMSRDGLIPSVFSEVHPTYRTPAKNNMMFMLFVSLFAAFVPARVVGEMTSIGTLFAFILVCIGIIVLRRTMPDAPRSFKTPLVPLVPILGIATCLFMMVFLPLDTWIRLIVWMMIGIDIFAAYGFKKSVYTEHQRSIKEKRIIGYSGLLLALALFVVASFHHLHTAGNDSVLFYFSVIFASVHVVYYAWKFVFIGMPQK